MSKRVGAVKLALATAAALRTVPKGPDRAKRRRKIHKATRRFLERWGMT